MDEESNKFSNDKLYGQWHAKWGASNYPDFIKCFNDHYKKSDSKAKSNRNDNFNKKKYYIRIFIVCGVFQLILFFASLILGIMYAWNIAGIKEYPSAAIIASEALLLAGCLTLGYAVSKKIDVNKYQETWVRHENTVYCMTREMLLYVEDLKPYNNSDPEENRKTFIANIIAVMDDNQKKFVSNMETKEIGIREGVSDMVNRS